jgi:acyl-[acyl-carrier-protein]-phospholipid O-acyltransferase/long-chain-fatty-acid--[acyl-carrier-protein] ligase
MVPHGTVEEALRKVMGLTDAVELKVAVASTADPQKGEQLVVLHTEDVDVEAIRAALAAEGLANLMDSQDVQEGAGHPDFRHG